MSGVNALPRTSDWRERPQKTRERPDQKEFRFAHRPPTDMQPTMNHLIRLAVILVIGLVQPAYSLEFGVQTGGTLPANSEIPLCETHAPAIGPADPEWEAISSGFAALNQMNPQVAGDLAAAISAGHVRIVVLDWSILPAKAVTDATTIALKLKHHPTADDIAIALEHEYPHYRDGVNDSIQDGGILNDCDHFLLSVQTMIRACTYSCEPNHHVSCGTIHTALASTDMFYFLCLESGGNPPYPVSWPASCCQ